MMKNEDIPLRTEKLGKIGQKIWRIEWQKKLERCWGEAVWESKTVQLKSGMSHKRETTVLIEEVLHICDWDMEHRKVKRLAKNISKAIWILLEHGFGADGLSILKE